jgi:hypothetical protein
MADAQGWIDSFRQANNPLSIPAAAVQADIIAHSMGGDIARTMVLQPTFLGDNTFAQGSIHKLITIDTPHLGTQLAGDLGSSQEKTGCAAGVLAGQKDFVLNSVFFGYLGPVSGAIADLTPSSPALLSIANQGPRPLLGALIAGVEQNFVAPGYVAFRCPTDPVGLADASDSTWSSIMGSQLNDAIVSEASQLNGLGASPGLVFTGVIHTPSIGAALGFQGPSVLDPDSKTGIPSTVIK